MLVAPAGKLEGGPGDALTGGSSNLAYCQRHVLGGLKLSAAREHVPISIKTLGVFSHHHQIHVRGDVVHTGAGTAGAHIRVEIQRDADVGRRVDAALLRGRIVVGGYGSQNDAVGGAGLGHDVAGQGAGVTVQRRQSHGMFLETQSQRQLRIEDV